MRLLNDLLNSGASFDLDNREKYRINFMNVIFLATIPLFFIYSVVNLQKHIYTVAVVDLLICCVLLATFFFLRKTLNASKSANMILLILLPIFTTTMLNGGGLYQTGFYWYFFYPLFAILLKGNKKGIRWIAPFISVIFSYYLYIQIMHIEHAYDPNLLMVLGIALILETLTIMYYERVRKRFDNIIIAKNSELHELKHRLEDKVDLETQKNMSLNEELIEIQKDIIFTMGTIGETRSSETGNHVKRVAKFTRIFAQKLDLEDHIALMLEQASPMHDIGKVGIPDSILNKPASLTPEELTIMRTHASLGYTMLKNSNRSLLQMAATVAYEHHERYDGTGYPNGLKGEEIHIYARITALADVFDALGNERVYKKAWSDEEIFAYIKAERGKHFDPRLVDIFFEDLDEFLAIRQKYQD